MILRTWRKLPMAQVAAGRRLSSSNARKIQSYLDTWVGSSPTPSQSSTGSSASHSVRPSQRNSKPTRPLLLSGSSYLMPTLRLERADTPESISAGMATALEELSPSSPNAASVKSMLSGKRTANGTAKWRVPIVLDLGALVPDGSPHYVPPQNGLLSGVVSALDEFGISVMGITNAPPEVEQEAVRKLGFPAILSKSRGLDRHMDTKYRMEDVVQLVLDQVAEEADDIHSADVIQKCTSENSSMKETAVGSIQENNHLPQTLEEEEKVNGAVTNAGETELQANTSMIVSQMETTQGATRVYYGSVRSGQQIAAEKNQSLIVVGSVSSGGEVLADRDIFVLGKLRGRALAGLVPSSSDDKESARIFASSFDAELVCIGDTFTTVDNVKDLGLTHPGQAVTVSRNTHNELVFESVQLT